MLALLPTPPRGVDADAENPPLQLSVGGDARWFQFQALESVPGTDHSERAALRLKLEGRSEKWHFDLHGLAEGASPAGLVGGFSLGAARRGTRYFDLSTELDRNSDHLIVGSIDRASLRFQNEHVRVTVGRQAVTWGVNFFWPVLDLFSPFKPERIDRDYKIGVDAVRVTLPVGQFSELEFIGAVQGPDSDRDRSYGVLGRFHLGGADLGLMVGDFHHDRVLGAFVTGSLKGTGLRAELAHTEVGQRALAEGDPRTFVRATLGVDRLLSASVSLVFEAHWNEYGVSHAADFVTLVGRDRVQRGEVTSLGEWSSGVALSWQASPLTSFNASLLANLNDGSLLLQPSANRSLSNNADLLLGAIVGLGDQSTSGELASEYGAAPFTLWLALKASF